MINRLSDSQIDTCEQHLGYSIPTLYRRLLTDIGPGRQGDGELYHPEEIATLYAHHFEAPDQLFRVYCPFGCNHRTQDIWLIRIQDLAVAAIGHETHPDDYPEEVWLPFEQWLVAHRPQWAQA